MKKYLIALFSSCLFLSGCASNAPPESVGKQTFTSVESAAANVQSFGQINFGESKRVKIVEGSPSIDGSGATGRFEIVSLSGRAGDPYNLTAYSVCDCFGFKKWAVLPHLYLLDGSKKVVSKDAVVVSSRLRSLAGIFPKDDTYYLMIVADAKSEGKKLDDVAIGVALPGKGFVPDLLSVSMTSHPTGVVQIGWTK